MTKSNRKSNRRNQAVVAAQIETPANVNEMAAVETAAVETVETPVVEDVIDPDVYGSSATTF